LTRHTFTNAAGSRGYLLYVPPEFTQLPLIVFLHRCGAAPDAYNLQRIGEARVWVPVTTSYRLSRGRVRWVGWARLL
jgi:hypothetical protein